MSRRSDEDRELLAEIRGLKWDQQRIELQARDRCVEYVSGTFAFDLGRFCMRPVKSDGLCGIHLAAKQRRERYEAARKSVGQQHDAVAKALSRILDHPVSYHTLYGSYSVYTVDDVDETLVEFGIEPAGRRITFNHAYDCPGNATIGPLHVGESCYAYKKKHGDMELDLADLEEDE